MKDEPLTPKDVERLRADAITKLTAAHHRAVERRQWGERLRIIIATATLLVLCGLAIVYVLQP